MARAFQNIERDGIIRTVPGVGTFVDDEAALAKVLLKAEKLRRLNPIAQQLAVEAAQLRLCFPLGLQRHEHDGRFRISEGVKAGGLAVGALQAGSAAPPTCRVFRIPRRYQ